MSQMGCTPLTHGQTSPAASDVFAKIPNKRKRGGQQLSYARRVRQEIKLAYDAPHQKYKKKSVIAMTMLTG